MDSNPANVRFQQADAHNYRHGRNTFMGQTGQLGITIHTEESPETANSTDQILSYFAQSGTRTGAAHYCVDSDSTGQSVLDADGAYHAPPGNAVHIGIEQAGYSDQNVPQWHDPYSWAMLRDQTAPLIARKAKQYGFPIGDRFLTVADLQAGRFRGVTSHNNWSVAFHQSDHTDPGPGYPEAEVLQMANGLLVPPPPAAKTWGPGAVNDSGLAFIQAAILNPVEIEIAKVGDVRIQVREDGTWDATVSARVDELTKWLNTFISDPSKQYPPTGLLTPGVVGALAFWAPAAHTITLENKLNIAIAFLKIQTNPATLPANGTWNADWFYRLAAFQKAMNGMAAMGGKPPVLNVDGDRNNMATLNFINYWWHAAVTK